MKYTDQYAPLDSGCFYHIYNRGINGENLFYEHRNYGYFLQKYAQYLGDYVDTFAYCLLKNHFHLLIRVRNLSGLADLTGLKKDGAGLHHPDKVMSKKFSDFFNSFTKSINKAVGRSGGLFETPFRRIKIDHEKYFAQLVDYIHKNPQKHGFIDDIKEYPYSSYGSLLSEKPTRLLREEVHSWFGGKLAFSEYNLGNRSHSEFQQYIIEFD